MNRSSRSVTLLLIASPLFLAGCGTSDDGNRPGASGSGFHYHGFHSGSGGGSFGSGASVGSHASPGGGFGHIGMGAGG